MLRIVAIVAVWWCLSAGASTRARAQGGAWLALVGGYNTYEMAEFNRNSRWFPSSYAFGAASLENGYAFGAQAGVDISRPLSLAAGFERFPTSTDVPYFNGTADFDIPANVLYGRARYLAPWPGLLHLGLALAVGHLWVKGEAHLPGTHPPDSTRDVWAAGRLVDVHAVGEYPVSPQFVLVQALGYRFAKLDAYELDGWVVREADGSQQELDYSGLSYRVALKWLIGHEAR